jgi:uncharacterized RDD family membrane protein YckC
MAIDPIGDQLNIDTPELVSIEMPIAGVGSRFIAIMVDYLIWTGAFIVLVFLAAILIPALHFLGDVSVNWAIGIFFLIVFLLQWGYFTLFEAFNQGRTPGKSIAKIHVIHQSGRAISLVESLARNLLRFIDYLPGFYAVGLVTMLLNKQNRRLGDLVAGTLVVHDRDIESPSWGELGSRTITAPAFAAAEPLDSPVQSLSLPASSLAKLSSSDLEVLEGFFARRLDMDLATRGALAKRMALGLCAKSGLEMPSGTSIETFLEAIAHQLRELARMDE